MAYPYSYPYHFASGVNGQQQNIPYIYNPQGSTQNFANLIPASQYNIPASNYYGQQGSPQLNYATSNPTSSPGISGEDVKKVLSFLSFVVSATILKPSESPSSQGLSGFLNFLKTGSTTDLLHGVVGTIKGLTSSPTEPPPVEEPPWGMKSIMGKIMPSVFGSTKEPEVVKVQEEQPKFGFESLFKSISEQTTAFTDKIFLSPSKEIKIPEPDAHESSTLNPKHSEAANPSNAVMSSDNLKEIVASLTAGLSSLFNLQQITERRQNSTLVPPKVNFSRSTKTKRPKEDSLDKIKTKKSKEGSNKPSEITGGKLKSPETNVVAEEKSEKISGNTKPSKESLDSGGGLKDLFSSVAGLFTNPLSFLPQPLQDMLPQSKQQKAEEKLSPKENEPAAQETEDNGNDQKNVQSGRNAKSVTSKPESQKMKTGRTAVDVFIEKAKKGLSAMNITNEKWKKGRTAISVNIAKPRFAKNKVYRKNQKSAIARLFVKPRTMIGRAIFRPNVDLTDRSVPAAEPTPSTNIQYPPKYVQANNPQQFPKQPPADFYDTNPDPGYNSYDVIDPSGPNRGYDIGAPQQMKQPARRRQPAPKRRCDSRYERCEAKKIVRVEKVKTVTKYAAAGPPKRPKQGYFNDPQRPMYEDYPGYMSRNSKSLSGTDVTDDTESTGKAISDATEMTTKAN